MSGGPAFDRSGAVVGIVEGGHEELKALDLLTPISFATSLLESINSPLLNSNSTPKVAATSTPGPTVPNLDNPKERDELYKNYSEHLDAGPPEQRLKAREFFTRMWLKSSTARRLRWAGSLHGEDGPSSDKNVTAWLICIP